MMTRLGLLVFAGGALAIAAIGAPALAQSDRESEELSRRLDRIERDMRDIQAEIFRNTGRAYRSGNPPAASDAPAEMGSLNQRVYDMEESLRRLTGQVEQLSYEVRQIGVRLDRMQKDTEFRMGALGGDPFAAAPTGESTPPAEAAGAMQDIGGTETLASGPGILGTIPAGSLGALPQAKPGASAPVTGAPLQLTAPDTTPAAQPQQFAAVDPRTEYDTAMNLLAEGQYESARGAFRGFVDRYPRHDLAPQALYWTGDIAFVQKDYGESARAFAELLKSYPDSARAPEGMLKLGQSLLALGQKQEGCTTLGALPAKYPSASKTVTSRAQNERRGAGCG